MMIKGMNAMIVTITKNTIITARVITKCTILTASIMVLVITSALLIINYASLTKRSDRQGQAKALHMIHSVNRTITKARRLY
jgi:sensor domain CHASE-containing protein